jgi:hypothetical protein
MPQLNMILIIFIDSDGDIVVVAVGVVQEATYLLKTIDI